MPNNNTPQKEGASNEKGKFITLQMHKDILNIEQDRFEFEKTELTKRFQDECDKLKAKIEQLNRTLDEKNTEIRKRRAEIKDLRSEADGKLKALKQHTVMRKHALTKPGSKHDVKWKSKFDELKEFKAKYGHCNLSKGAHMEQYKELHTWVTTQRTQYRFMVEGKESNLNPERIRLLNSIDFAWSLDNRPVVMSWEMRFEQLLEYKEEHGDLRVPQKLPNPPGLGNFVLDQRRNYRELQNNPNHKSPLTPERIQLLESIGFEWSLRNRTCVKKYKNHEDDDH